MPTGTIARLLIDKGFGFIRDEGGIEHFFHRSAVRGSVFELLREGQRVEFTAEDSTTWARPWTVNIPMAKSGEEMYEYACHEGNYGLRHVLEGARFLEKEDAEHATNGAPR